MTNQHMPPAADPQRAPRVAARPLRTTATFLAAALATGVATVLTLRSLTPTQPVVVAAVAFTPFAVVPALVALLAALWSGRRVLTAATVAIGLAFALIVTPHAFLGGCTTSAGDGEIRILTANIEARHGQPREIAELVATSHPDIVLLQEVEPRILRALESEEAMEVFPYRSVPPQNSPFSVVVWSRWPIDSVETQSFSGAALVHSVVASPAGPVTVSGVHTTSPDLPGFVTLWAEQLATLSGLDTSSPRILAGDFNATADHRPFREILRSGWTDAYDERGCGLDATWPARVVPFAFYRLDHVLVTDHFQIESMEVRDLPGSDHKPLLVSVQLRQDTMAGDVNADVAGIAR
ncbi:MAG: endonuclease/exonuclease/phosphatase family protein [bacterium]|nr:endonuclease/exonuclease/phosphatase family protein [bacterium]MCP4966108.1 endonuclease/exonuclease/phosphatase family protein [bacterium]